MTLLRSASLSCLAIILAIDFAGQKMCRRQLEIAIPSYGSGRIQHISGYSFDTLNGSGNSLIWRD
jgi:hypothetical protein